MSKKLTTQDFITKASLIHKDKYDYSLVNYLDSKSKVIIICKIHGEFLQSPTNHLNGKGCRKCNPGGFDICSFNEFKNKANKRHNFYYNYDKTDYRGGSKSIIIICPIHGEFQQTPNNHLQGNGCRRCGVPGYSKTDWLQYCNTHKNIEPKVYIIRCFNNNEEFVKIGMTTKSIFKRFQSNLPYEYEVIKEIKGSPEFVYDLEHSLHSKYKDFKYLPLISFGGYTECFKISIYPSLVNFGLNPQNPTSSNSSAAS